MIIIESDIVLTASVRFVVPVVVVVVILDFLGFPDPEARGGLVIRGLALGELEILQRKKQND